MSYFESTSALKIKLYQSISPRQLFMSENKSPRKAGSGGLKAHPLNGVRQRGDKSENSRVLDDFPGLTPTPSGGGEFCEDLGQESGPRNVGIEKVDKFVAGFNPYILSGYRVNYNSR